MKEFVDVDVRPILLSGQEPFSVIMAAMAELEPGQGMRLFATVKPVPLFGVMARHGFAHEETEIEGGDWEVRFTPVEQAREQGSGQGPAVAGVSADSPAAASCGECCAQSAPDAPGLWPEPVLRLDNRELEPPEPMVRTLAALEELTPGQTLVVQLDREPVFLFAQLEKRGHQWRGGKTADGAGYEVIIRVGKS